MKRINIISSRLMTFFSIIFITILLITQIALGATYNPKEDYQNLEIHFLEDEQPDVGFYINASSRYILETVPEPNFGTSFGEWSVMDLLRGMYTGADYINYIPEDYFENYISNVETHVKGKEGKLDRSKLTEWSRAVLALTPLGYDITDVAGYNFIDAHSVSPTNAITYNSNTEKISYTQGINAAIFGIIAMNTGDYELPDDNGDP